MSEHQTFNDAADIVHRHFEEFIAKNKHEFSKQQMDMVEWLEHSILTEFHSFEKEQEEAATNVSEGQMDIYDIIGE